MYYTIIVKYGKVWGPEFGDSDFDVANDELQNYYENGFECKMIKTDEDQDSINKAISKLNEEMPCG